MKNFTLIMFAFIFLIGADPIIGSTTQDIDTSKWIEERDVIRKMHLLRMAAMPMGIEQVVRANENSLKCSPSGSMCYPCATHSCCSGVCIPGMACFGPGFCS